MMRKKRIYTVAAVCLLVFLYMMIFLLSSDVAEDSSMKSSAVTELLLKIWSFFQNSDGTPTTEIVVDLFPLALEKIVRKLAHFSVPCSASVFYIVLPDYQYITLMLSDRYPDHSSVFCKSYLRTSELLLHQRLLPSAQK